MKTFIIKPDEDQIRLDRWFKRHYPTVSFTLVVKLLRKGQIKLDGKRAKPSQRIATGQTIAAPDALLLSLQTSYDMPIQLTPEQPHYRKLVDEIKKNIIYKDDDIIAINKPMGVAVQGGTDIKISIADILNDLRFEYDISPKIVHRLDRDTSGVLLLARTSAVAALLADMFKHHKIEKKYVAIVVGIPKKPEGVITFPISKTSHNGVDLIAKDEENGKEAITHYKVIRSSNNLSLMEFEPITGRTHQLRIHSALMGWPILGDGKYGKRVADLPLETLEEMPKRLYLHAQEMNFNLKGKALTITVRSSFGQYIIS
jgi:23S rRNA pseudouridine955/2504/2580 synthase